MDLPATIDMVSTGFNEDRRGASYSRKVDNQGLGVAVVITRAGWGRVCVESWTHAAAPHTTWASYSDMRLALRSRRPEAFAVALAPYPRIASVLGDLQSGAGGPCSACCPGSASATPAVAQAFIDMSWRLEDRRHVQLCVDHRALLNDPRALMQAIDAARAQPTP